MFFTAAETGLWNWLEGRFGVRRGFDAPGLMVLRAAARERFGGTGWPGDKRRRVRWTRLVRQSGGLAKVDRVGFYAANCSVISAIA